MSLVYYYALPTSTTTRLCQLVSYLLCFVYSYIAMFFILFVLFFHPSSPPSFSYLITYYPPIPLLPLLLSPAAPTHQIPSPFHLRRRMASRIPSRSRYHALHPTITPHSYRRQTSRKTRGRCEKRIFRRLNSAQIYPRP